MKSTQLDPCDLENKLKVTHTLTLSSVREHAKFDDSILIIDTTNWMQDLITDKSLNLNLNLVGFQPIRANFKYNVYLTPRDVSLVKVPTLESKNSKCDLSIKFPAIS